MLCVDAEGRIGRLRCVNGCLMAEFVRLRNVTRITVRRVFHRTYRVANGPHSRLKLLLRAFPPTASRTPAPCRRQNALSARGLAPAAHGSWRGGGGAVDCAERNVLDRVLAEVLVIVVPPFLGQDEEISLALHRFA